VQISYGGAAPKPGQAGSYGPNVVGQNSVDPCPTCKLINLANGKPILGTSFAAAHTSDAYFAFGGTASGPYNYPHKAYSPLTHNTYACVRATHSGKGNAGSFAGGTESLINASVAGATTDPRLFHGVVLGAQHDEQHVLQCRNSFGSSRADTFAAAIAFGDELA